MGATEPKLPVGIGDLVGGKYSVERIVGSGGMGVIASARHIQLDQRVALKFLHAHVVSNEQAVTRFLREARSTVRLKSDHVARVFDVDTLPTGEPYVVMELLEGVDLAHYARHNGPLRIADAVEFVVQACEGIIEAHSLGIVHRDLKPQNLFVTRRINGSPRLKVLDFGISKSIGGSDFSLTDSTVVLGSPLYMSPEQMKASRNVDVRSDIWSLGVILYELLTGSVPFDGESITELCLKVVTGDPVAPREMRSDIPESLATTVVRCLEKDPNRRFPSVAALAEALEPFSAAAERGATDRSWRSLVETSDALQIAQPITTPPAASTHSTWDKLAEAPPPSRRRGFYRGVAAGIVLTAVGVVATLGLLAYARGSATADAHLATGAPVVVERAAVETSSAASSVAVPNVEAPTVSATATAVQAPAPSTPQAGVASGGTKSTKGTNAAGGAATTSAIRTKAVASAAGATPNVPVPSPAAPSAQPFRTTANEAPILP